MPDIGQMHEVRMAVKENVLSDPSVITPAMYEEHLTHRGKGWVCLQGDSMVGFSVVDLLGGSVWALFIRPEFESMGIGRRLHDMMLDWYFSQGRESLWLSTAPNSRAEQFYRAAGWIETGLHGSELRFEMTNASWLRPERVKNFFA